MKWRKDDAICSWEWWGGEERGREGWDRHRHCWRQCTVHGVRIAIPPPGTVFFLIIFKKYCYCLPLKAQPNICVAFVARLFFFLSLVNTSIYRLSAAVAIPCNNNKIPLFLQPTFHRVPIRDGRVPGR